MESKRNATQASLQACASETEKGIISPLAQVVKVLFSTLFFPCQNVGRVTERLFHVPIGFSDKGKETWKDGDKGLISLFRSILSNGFDSEKGTFGVKPYKPEDSQNGYYIPCRDKTPKAIQGDKVIESLVVEDSVYSDIAKRCQPVNPQWTVTGGFNRLKILYTLVALGILTVEQIQGMSVRVKQTIAEIDNIRDSFVKTNPLEVLKSAFVLLTKNPSEKILYCPKEGTEALCSSKGNAGVFYCLFLVCQKTETTIETLLAILQESGRIPNQAMRKEILTLADCNGKSFQKSLTTKKAKEILAFLSSKPEVTDNGILDTFPDDSIRQKLADAFKGKQWKTVNSFFRS